MDEIDDISVTVVVVITVADLSDLNSSNSVSAQVNVTYLLKSISKVGFHSQQYINFI